MIIKKQLTLQTTRTNIIETLQRYIRNIPPYGRVDESSFCIYITTRVPYRKTTAVYVVSGEIVCIGDKVQITMKIRPNTVVFLLAVILSTALFVGLYSFIFNTTALEYVIGVIAFNLLFHLLLAGEMHDCISKFINELK